MKLMGAPARILVAEDFESWRVKIRSILQAQPEWQIVCEVSDGLQAVEKTEELSPDVVLLDVGMPVLNGVEAAKRIRQKAPNAKLLFLTQDGDNDTRTAALNTGAEGYLLKSKAASELVPSIAAALRSLRVHSVT
jgi:DNA-binding NarL/FixJ family response regulator